MIVLGSTGSIGKNTLEIAKKFSLDIEVLVAGNNIELLNQQIQQHNPKRVIIASKNDRDKVAFDNVEFGQDAILNAIEESQSQLVVNALVGFLGLAPTIKAIECKKKVALANKESLVAGGEFIDTSYITPIDSEHFGLWYLLQDKTIESMTITASGGAFRDWKIDDLKRATLADTQKHPNWSMGQKITIDSATMVNKLFELLEARWLFGEGSYNAIIETKSLIHALINFRDGSTTAHIAHANMQLPIAYALLGKVETSILQPIDLVKIGSLEFKEIQTQRYPVWEIKEEILNNPHKGAIINAANEVAIKNFIAKKIGFMDIAKHIIYTLNQYHSFQPQSIHDIFNIDQEIRERGL